MNYGRFLGVIATALVVGFCGALAAKAAVVSGSAIAGRTDAEPQRGRVAPEANPNHAWLYVSSDRNNVVTAYDLERRDAPLVRAITRGVSSPGGIALDANGTLYVPNENAATVTIYPAGSNTPSLTLTGTDSPEGVAVDASGNVYVANRGSNPGIAIYPAGQTTPSQHVTSSLIHTPTQLAFDTMGTLYITDVNTGVLIWPPGPSQTVTSLNLGGLHRVPAGIAIDTNSGDIFVSSSSSPPDFLDVYAPGSQNPSHTKRLNYGGLDFLGIGTLRGEERLFVPDSLGGYIDVFDASNLRRKPDTITTAHGYVAVGVAFKPAGVP
jgi:hypothetical protein